MPELPEVETIRRDLTRAIVGRRFAAVDLKWPRMVLYPSPEAFSRRLKGQGIRDVGRRGKYLLVHLDGGDTLVLHFRMSGSLLLADAGPDDPYCRAVFTLDDGSRLCFRDPRKLGKMWLVEDEATVVGSLGPEVLDSGFTVDGLTRALAGHAVPIKALLCDQTVLAGVGNMYADEALFAAGIHPLRRADSLGPGEAARLHRALVKVLSEAIESHGASMTDYWRPSGEPGTAQSVFKVAHRLGAACPGCGAPIERLRVRGRGSYFCPNCQCESG
ncbi:MAG: bifunctional DNA-formamidopyrimidine glycosylase/DNA-(apurinic or apyrimidinic site) lyase [Chloroflexota bacterium]|nr:bifunctional DNA-formamidopyrimidine glycosylase/DNA-(apurinic or apyrimidinic site) lyase [Chloroflexota bacterium]